ncbi:MAG: transposase [Rhodocyclaceae bacterium]|nr:transposase [Rhodocyclaceae bacterium]
MQVMSEREADRQLDGRVEIDDAYLGGELPGGKSGRGSENKVSFIAAVQTTETGNPLKVCLKKLEFTKEAITDWAKTALSASTWCRMVCGASAPSPGPAPPQERIVTGGGPACCAAQQCPGILLGISRPPLGTYHAFDLLSARVGC